MNIAGFQKTSFVDFPKTVACVVFTPGCNMNCGYCHNKHILGRHAPKIELFSVMEYLNKRRGSIKGVVVSGGEPTLQAGLFDFIKTVKEMGYKVKLDTNGTNPEALRALCECDLLDYIAMDIKANLPKYSLVSGREIDTDKIMESVGFIKACGVEHEFRTTFCPMLTKEDVIEISAQIVGDSDYYLQQYRQVEGGGLPHSREYLTETADAVVSQGGKCVIRGL